MKQFERILKWYPSKHLFGSWYLVRNKSHEASKFSFWLLLNSKKYQRELGACVPRGEFRIKNRRESEVSE